MALATAVQGAIRPYQVITWTREDGEPEDLTGATLTGFVLINGQGDLQSIEGSLVVFDGPNGVFRWEYSDNDVAVPGHHQIQFWATFDDDPSPAKTFVSIWKVERSL